MKKALLSTTTLVLTLLLILFDLNIAVFINTAQAAKLKTFQPPRMEDQMLDWLKEHNYEIEKLDENLYAISWEQDLPQGQIKKVYPGMGVLGGCEVLIESINGKNTARFTFSLSLNVNTDVVVSSEVKWIKQLRPFSEKYGYHYHIECLSTSSKPVNTFQIYYIQRYSPHTDNIPRLKEISDPSGLWENSEHPSLTVRSLKSVMWKNKEVGIIAGESQYGFAFDTIVADQSGFEDREFYLSIPGIVTACVDVDRTSGIMTPILKIDGQTRKDLILRRGPFPPISRTPVTVQIDRQTVDLSSEKTVEELLFQIRPRGKVVGPEAISKEWDALKLIQRLETLTSQSVAEGWLNESAAKPLKHHLAESQTAFQNGQQTQAKQAIQKFETALKQMEKEIKPSNSSQDSPLTQEAATLLGTNAVYLLTKF